MIKDKLGFLAIALCLLLFMTGCVSNQMELPEKKSEPQQETNIISYEEEDETAELDIKKADVSDFFGSWEAKSDQAHFLFGNIDISIKSDYTWVANITDEKLSGKWREVEEGIYLTSEIFECSFSFTTDGVLVMKYYADGNSNGEDAVSVVLTKK